MSKKISVHQISVHQIEDLSHEDSKDEILLETNLNTQLHIIRRSNETIIHLPYGNRIDTIRNQIIIHEK